MSDKIDKSGWTDERDKRGRWITPHPGKTVITSATASTLANKRWEKFRAAAAARVLAEGASVDPSVKTTADAWGMVVAKQYVALLDSDKPRVDDLQKMGSLIGARPDAHELTKDDSRASDDGYMRGILADIAAIARASTSIDMIDTRNEIIDE